MDRMSGFEPEDGSSILSGGTDKILEQHTLLVKRNLWPGQHDLAAESGVGRAAADF